MRILLQITLLTLLSLSGNVPAPAADAAARVPNIVIVFADDLGIGDVSCYNKESKIPTPHIDRLATQGMQFSDAHSGHCVCTPSRYSLLMGRYSWRGPLLKGIIWSYDPCILEQDKINMASLLKKSDYATYCVGKWHLGWDWPFKEGGPKEARKNGGSTIDFSRDLAGGPTSRGFDYYFGEDVINLQPFVWIENNRFLEKPTKLYKSYDKGLAIESWNDVEVLPRDTAKAVEIIKAESKREGPFFLYFSLPAPHTPHVPTPEFTGRTSIGKYGDFVAQVDGVLGEVVSALEDSGQLEDTLLIFTSDHGSPELKLRELGHHTNGIYRGRKHTNWEGGYRIPLIVSWPDKVRPGSRNDQLVSQIDLLATFAEITRQEIGSDEGAEDSISLLPTLLDSSKTIREDLVMVNNGGNWACRLGYFKYFDKMKLVGEPGVKLDGPGLFNLAEDPGERDNLHDRNPEKVQELLSLLEGYKKQYAEKK